MALGVGGCDWRYALLGWPQAQVHAQMLPVTLPYREARGGLMLVTGRVNDRADVEFVLDTGAPVTVLVDGAHTKGLGLDSSRARRLGDPDNPATPLGDIQEGFRVVFGSVRFEELAAVVIPGDSMPCRERMDEIAFGGVIGADVFRRFVVEVDTARRRITLHDPRAWRAPEGAASVPLNFHNGHPFVTTSLRADGAAPIEARMNLDTGMNRALTVAAGTHPALPMPTEGKLRKSCFVNGMREEREGRPLAVSLGGRDIPVAAPIYSEHPNAVDGQRAGSIGIGLFAGRSFVIDYPGRRLLLP